MPGDIDFNPIDLLRSLLLRHSEPELGPDSRTVKAVTPKGTAVLLTASADTGQRAYPISSLEIAGESVRIQFSNFKLKADTNRCPVRLTKSALEKLRLPLRELTADHWNAAYLSVPSGFPRNQAEKQAAKSLGTLFDRRRE
ncbi:MAG: hypothetical protein ACYDH9_27395 [Limisphaerales bacterium]